MPLPGVTCSFLPVDMRELAEQWKSSGSVKFFDFGSDQGTITASNITTDVALTQGSLAARLDAMSLDYSTSFAFGPIETGSVISGSIFKAWRVQHIYNPITLTGSVYLTRENDTGDNWRSDLLLFRYTGSIIGGGEFFVVDGSGNSVVDSNGNFVVADFISASLSLDGIKEIDLTFDQSGRAIVSGDRDISYATGSATQSLVWLYHLDAGNFIWSPIATGSNPRIMLDDLRDSANSDVLVFYVRRFTPEANPTFVYATGSGASGSVSSSYGTHAEVTLSLNPYFKSRTNEAGVFTSKIGTGASVAITGAFNVGVKSVGAIISDPDLAGNLIIGYDASGNEIQRKQFLFDGVTAALSKNIQMLTASGDFGTGSSLIRSFVLVPAATDYVGYDAIVFEPTATITSSRNWSFNEVFWRQQRDNYLIEYIVPLTEKDFFSLFDFITGSFTGTFGFDSPAGMTGWLFPTGVASGGFVGKWSGSATGGFLLYFTGSGVSGSRTASLGNGLLDITMSSYNTLSVNGQANVFGPGADWTIGNNPSDWAPFVGVFGDYSGHVTQSRNSMSVTFSAPGVSRFEVVQWGDTLSRSMQAYDVTGNLIQHFALGGYGVYDASKFWRFRGSTTDFLQRSNSVIDNPFVTASGDSGTGSAPIYFIGFEDLPTSGWGPAGDNTLGPPAQPQFHIFDAFLITPFQTDISGTQLISGTFVGLLTGSLTGSIWGYASGTMSGGFSGTHGQFQGDISGTTSQSIVPETAGIYEVFLEDVVKQTDTRLALYVTRRIIDSSSVNFGEYRIQKFETVLYPIPSDADQYSASTDWLSSSLNPVIILTQDNFDFGAIVSMSAYPPSGGHEFRSVLLTHSIYDTEAIVSMSAYPPSGGHEMRNVLITHSIYDTEAIVSMSAFTPSGSHQLRTGLTILHTAYDKEAFISMSCRLTSGSLENE